MPNKEDEESVVAIANPIDIKARVPDCYSTNTHTHRAPSFHSPGCIRRCNREIVAIRVCFCFCFFSAATRTGNRFVRVLGTLVVTIGDPSPLESLSTSSQPHLAARVFAGSWEAFIVTVGARIHFSATTQREPSCQ